MKLKGIKTKSVGEHLALHHLYYENRVGLPKIYEMVSRNLEITLDNSGVLSNKPPQAVVLVVFNDTMDKILVNKEFRMAVNTYIYNLPAGLIEGNESYVDAAKRELKEETGLDLIEILDILPPSFSSVGLSNEKTVTIFCKAAGVIGGNPEVDEEIEAYWFNKDEITGLMQGDILMAARTQMFCYLWTIGKI